MKALIYILAILLMAAGVAVGLMSFFSPGEVVLGFNLGLAATLLTGGVVTLALAGVMTAIGLLRRQVNRLARTTAGEAGGAATEAGGAAPSAERLAKAVAGTAAASAVAPEAAEEAGEDDGKQEGAEETEAAAPASPREIFVSPRDEVAVEAVEEAAEPEGEAAEAEPEAAAAEAAEVEEEAEAEEVQGDELYVVEERIIRGRPARILSDNTVEAETDEGWMRFENLEHLEEYLEAMSHAR